MWHEDGLLGVGDPGPPAFREAHAAYVSRRAQALQDVLDAVSLIDTSDIPEATASDFARARLSYPRPRLALHDLLVPVETYYREMRDAIKLGAGGAGYQAALDNLVAWFAERGVDIDPEA